MLDHLFDVCTNRYGYHAMLCLIRKCPPTSFHRLLEGMLCCVMKLSCHEFGNWIIQEMLKCGPVQSWCVALQFVFFPKYDVRCDLHRIEKGNYGCAQFADTADLVDAQLQDWAIALQDGRELSLRCRNKLEMTHLALVIIADRRDCPVRRRRRGRATHII